MRAATLLVAFFATATASAMVLGLACSSNNGSQTQGPNGPTSEQPSSGAATGTTTVTLTSTPSDPSKPESGNPHSDITNDPPDGGVVMNNATPSEDAGNSDRLKPIMDVIQKNRDKYRLCFDIWGKKNPNAPETKITLAIKLSPTGEVLSTAFKPDASDIQDKAVESCMVDVTRSLKFPASPSEKETTYNHPFKFQPHKFSK